MLWAEVRTNAYSFRQVGLANLPKIKHELERMKTMAKDEAKQMRDEAKNNRRASGETGSDVPLVSAKRGKFAALENAKVEALVFARLEDYKTFVA